MQKERAIPVAIARLFKPILAIFAFSIAKIVIRGQIDQQLVKPVLCTFFPFSIYKNRRAGAVMLPAGLFYVIHPQLFLFFCSKVQKSQYGDSSFDKLVAYISFSFSAYKNCNARAVILVASQAGRIYLFLLLRSLKLCQQLIKLVTHTYIHFLIYKNHNIGTTMSTTGQAGCTDVFSIFCSKKSQHGSSCASGRALLSNESLAIFVLQI